MSLVPLDGLADLSTAGGKGVNLMRMRRAGLPVPDGFVITTAAYREHVRATGLQRAIDAALAGLSHDPADLDSASAAIAAAFARTTLDATLADHIVTAWRALGSAAVAVRSSATAEDLPDLSFAGQQDTYLDVRDEAGLLDAVRCCWASLWTARAIGYRRRARLEDDVALAVVVQQLVDAEVSGVLFTANPLTGQRDQSVIDATDGLGEALVSGLVEPDHIVADTATGRIVDYTVGERATLIRPGQTGAETQHREAQTQPALTSDQVRAIVALGRQVSAQYDSPQDIEWAWADDQAWLLQTRAITSLFPVPPAEDDQLAAWASFGAVQGMLEPLTPLGRDVLMMILAGAATAAGMPRTHRTQGFLRAAGERLWIRVDGPLRNRLGQAAAPSIMRFVDPTIAGVAAHLVQEPAFAASSGRLAGMRALGGVLRRLLRPVLPSSYDPRATLSGWTWRSSTPWASNARVRSASPPCPIPGNGWSIA